MEGQIRQAAPNNAVRQLAEFEDYLSREAARLRRILFRRTRVGASLVDTAIAQVAWAIRKRLRSGGPIELRQSWMSYVKTSCVNYIARELRAREEENCQERYDERDPAIVRHIEARFRRERSREPPFASVVQRAVDQLPTHLREVIRLRYWQSLSFAEIAALQGITRDGAMVYASKARDILRARLQAEPEVQAWQAYMDRRAGRLLRTAA